MALRPLKITNFLHIEPHEFKIYPFETTAEFYQKVFSIPYEVHKGFIRNL